MRKVKFIKEYKSIDGYEFGYFHEWMQYIYSMDGGFDTNAVAIIELPNGTIHQISASYIQFVSPSKDEK